MTQKITAILAVLILTVGCSKEEQSEPADNSDEPTAEEPEFQASNTDLLDAVPSSVLANEVVEFRPAAEHHFAEDAPQKCAGFGIRDKTPRALSCQFTRPGTHRVALNVCDDANTYCKMVDFEVAATAPRGYEPGGEHAEVMQPPKKQHASVDGFLVNEPKKAKQRAKADDALIFVHFYGAWCPPCNMLEEHVYGEQAFMEATDGMVRVMLDADSDLSWAWKDRFNVGGYPTVIIANADLQEISRVVGYRPTATVVDWVERARSNANTPIEPLAEQYGDDPTAAPAAVRKRLGTWRYDRGEYAKAVAWLEDHPGEEAALTGRKAQLRLAQKQGDDEARIAALEALVEHHSDDVYYAMWVEDLVAAEHEGARELIPGAIEKLQSWAKSDDLAKTGFSRADLAWLEADLHRAAGRDDAAKNAYRRSADLYGEMAADSSLDVARGANLERAHALHKAGANKEARALYEKLIEAYEGEFTFAYNYAYTLHELGEHEQAYEHVKTAQKNAYGDNWLRAVHLRAKIERELGEPATARETLENALAEAVVPRTTDVRTHRYIQRLRSLQTELAGSTP